MATEAVTGLQIALTGRNKEEGEQMNTARTLEEQQALVDAARSGDRLKMLIALRDMLAERLQASRSDRDVASMSRRLMQCADEIEEIQREQEALAEKQKSLIERQRAILRGERRWNYRFDLDEDDEEDEE